MVLTYFFTYISRHTEKFFEEHKDFQMKLVKIDYSILLTCKAHHAIDHDFRRKYFHNFNSWDLLGKGDYTAFDKVKRLCVNNK